MNDCKHEWVAADHHYFGGKLIYTTQICHKCGEVRMKKKDGKWEPVKWTYWQTADGNIHRAIAIGGGCWKRKEEK